MLLDQFLGWAVIAFPFLLSILFIFIPAKTEDEGRHMKWRYGLVVVGAIFSLLAWWQQSRAIRASTKDKEAAITETSEKVAVKVAADVAKVVTEQYVGILADQKAQITQFQNRVEAQVASLKAQFETARKHGDNQLAAVYQTQLREILIREVAPTVIAQMQAAYDSWKTEDTTSRHRYPLGKGDPQYFKDQESFARSYTASLKSTMVNANFVREQLLDTVTVEVREKTLNYPQIVPVFESGKTGQAFKLDELGMAIIYMNKLVRVISALPPPQPQQ